MGGWSWCYMKSMRVFLLILVFAIGFSGYSAAAPAFATSIDHAHVEQSVTGVDVSDSAAMPAQDVDHHSSKAPCLDCVHCCSAHITFAQPNLSIGFESQGVILAAFVNVHNDSGYLLSLLRPPQALI